MKVPCWLCHLASSSQVAPIRSESEMKEAAVAVKKKGKRGLNGNLVDEPQLKELKALVAKQRFRQMVVGLLQATCGGWLCHGDPVTSLSLSQSLLSDQEASLINKPPVEVKDSSEIKSI